MEVKIVWIESLDTSNHGLYCIEFSDNNNIVFNSVIEVSIVLIEIFYKRKYVYQI